MTRHRFWYQAGFDGLAWVPGLWIAALLRYDLNPAKVPVREVALFCVLAVVAQASIGRAFGLYVHRWRYATFEEIVAMAKATLVTAAALTAIDLFPPFGRPVPLSATISGGLIAMLIMASGRFAWRIYLDRVSTIDGEHREAAIVFGAGEAGLQIVKAMHRGGPYRPVAVLDDNPDLGNLVVKGVHVRGDRSAIADVAADTGASVIVIAIPSAGSTLIREVVHLADEAGLTTMVLPPVTDLLGDGVAVSDIRPLTEADLLGRRELSLDIDAVAGYLTDRRVLVTGAGLARHVGP